MNDTAGFFVLRYIDPGTGYTLLNIGGWFIAMLVGLLGVFSLFFKRLFNFFKKHWKWITIILIAIILAALAITGVFMKANVSAFDKRVVVLGFDALSPEIIEPMMREGKLPNFSRLAQEGSYRQMSTTNPPQSPVAWSGFATGKNPGKHGIFDFIVRDPKTYGMSLSLSKMVNGRPVGVVRSKSFWDYTSEKNVPTYILVAPVTYPPGKICGKMLSGMGVPDILGTEGTFTFYTSEDLEKDKVTGGKVFRVRKSPLIVMDLIGPRVGGVGMKADFVKVPFRLEIKDPNTAVVEVQKKRSGLEVGKWSNWQEVTFDLGLFRKAKGIFKFYLVSTEPEFKLYISPINFDPRDPLFPISYPGNYSKELAERIGLFYTQGMPLDTWAVNEGRMTEKPFLEQAEAVLKENRAMLDLELNKMEKGVLFVYFEHPDIIQHMFWRYLDPEHPLYEKDAADEYKGMIEKWYKKMDEILGSVMERLSKDDTLIVLSDHGFGSFKRAAHINSWLKKNGYLELKNPYADEGTELLADIDWSKTKAYAIGFGAIYINQKGREAQGIVSPGKETEDLKDEIVKKLEGWIDEKSGKNAVSKAYKREEAFHGEYAGETPDIYVGFNRGYRASWQTAMGGVPRELFEDNLKKWSGDHLFDPKLVPGVLLSSRAITKKDPSVYDIAPTILKVTGYKDEELKGLDLDGEPLF